VLLFFAKKILFGMWVLILTLQFLVIMSTWQIRYSYRLQVALQQLKSLTLGEFTEGNQIGDYLSDWLGLETKKHASEEEVIGEERLGPTSFLSSFGPTLIVASASLLGVVVILTIIIIVLKRLNLASKAMQTLKHMLFFNPFIRYFMLNALKFNQMSLVIFKRTENDFKEIIYAVLLLVFMALLPLVAFCILKRLRGQLEETDKHKTWGSCFKGKRVYGDHKVHYYPVVFFLRRTIFSVATVYAFDHPQIQMIIHHVLTLATMVHIAHD